MSEFFNTDERIVLLLSVVEEPEFSADESNEADFHRHGGGAKSGECGTSQYCDPKHPRLIAE